MNANAAQRDLLIECVPNFSEGHDLGKVVEIIRVMRVDGVSLLDYSLDRDHNRSVVTIAGPMAAVQEAAIRAAGRAAELIDLTIQQGVHPRIGAADVIPFVPLAHTTLEQCAIVARAAGLEIWKRYGVPVYFYEAAAARPDRALLEDVRKGQFEGLREAVKREVSRRPDVGGPDLHPSAGACALGARRLLIAYNIGLDTADVTIARTIAREIRAARADAGKLAGVKALGLVVDGRAQISLNITDFRRTPVGVVHAAVSTLAERLGVRPVSGELIGLLPEAAYERDSEWVRQLERFVPEDKVLERKLLDPMPWP